MPAVGATDQSLDVRIFNDEGLPATGLVAATMPTVKMSKGTGSDITLSLVDLDGLASAHTDGGVKERGEGAYRLDLPDTFASTAAIVTLRGEATNKRLVHPPIQIGNNLPVVVSLLYGETVPRAFSFTGDLYLGEIALNAMQVLERNPTTGALSAKDLSGIASISLTLVDYAGTQVQHIADAQLDRSDDANGNIGWTNNSDVTLSERKLRAYVWNDAGPVLLMEGSLTIKYAKRGA